MNAALSNSEVFPSSQLEPLIVPDGHQALVQRKSVKNANPFFSRVPHGVKGKLAAAERLHPGKHRLKRRFNCIRTWASVDQEDVEVIPVPLHPDIRDVVELLVLFRRQNAPGFQDLLDEVFGLCFNLGLHRSGY